MNREFTKDVDGIEVSEMTDNFWQQARSRDETVNTFDCKCSGKDGKAFWFLAGYRSGKSDFSESVAGKIQGDNVTLGGSQPPQTHPDNREET